MEISPAATTTTTTGQLKPMNKLTPEAKKAWMNVFRDPRKQPKHKIKHNVSSLPNILEVAAEEEQKEEEQGEEAQEEDQEEGGGGEQEEAQEEGKGKKRKKNNNNGGGKEVKKRKRSTTTSTNKKKTPEQLLEERSRSQLLGTVSRLFKYAFPEGTLDLTLRLINGKERSRNE